MNRVRIFGEITHRYEQVVELSDEKLQELLTKVLNTKRKKGNRAIDKLLAENYADIDPVDSECGEWSADLIDGDGNFIRVAI